MFVFVKVGDKKDVKTFPVYLNEQETIVSTRDHADFMCLSMVV